MCAHPGPNIVIHKMSQWCSSMDGYNAFIHTTDARLFDWVSHGLFIGTAQASCVYKQVFPDDKWAKDIFLPSHSHIACKSFLMNHIAPKSHAKIGWWRLSPIAMMQEVNIRLNFHCVLMSEGRVHPYHPRQTDQGKIHNSHLIRGVSPHMLSLFLQLNNIDSALHLNWQWELALGRNTRICQRNTSLTGWLPVNWHHCLSTPTLIATSLCWEKDVDLGIEWGDGIKGNHHDRYHHDSLMLRTNTNGIPSHFVHNHGVVIHYEENCTWFQWALLITNK